MKISASVALLGAWSASLFCLGCGDDSPTREPNKLPSASKSTGGEGGDPVMVGDGGHTGIDEKPSAGGESPLEEKCSAAKSGLFCVADCQTETGPNSEVTDANVGAFTEDESWMEGWTNWSKDSSGVVDTAPEGDPTACDAVLDDSACTWLASDISSDMTLSADRVWGLYSKVHVLPGATLTIEPGTVIKGHDSSVGTLLVSRGATILAEGTQDKPIVFTSLTPEGMKGRATWGGVFLLGRAASQDGADALLPLFPADEANAYGCGVDFDECPEENESDSSGVLKYVRIEFGGNSVGSHHIGGLGLMSVGSGTTISHIQVSNYLTNGVTLRGGTVNLRHLVFNNVGDDMIDVERGYRGSIDTFFGRYVRPLSEHPHGFEGDSDYKTDAEPQSRVELKNGTLCGTGQLGKPDIGILLRKNMRGSIENVAAVGFDFGFDTRDDFLEANDSAKVTITNSTSWDHVSGLSNHENESGEADNDLGFDESAWFLGGEGNFSPTD